ncbi:hypothetical protein LEP1GSC018_2560 [Leptospira kirschneri str. 2008720114]|nr:hypothetical protein LEP1GSC018_2560 [Leptospira kirschneri str. 2008720114]
MKIKKSKQPFRHLKLLKPKPFWKRYEPSRNSEIFQKI